MKKLIALLLVSSLASCGGGTNNDQGTAFTLIGYSTSCEESPTTPNLTGLSVPIGIDTEPGSFAGGVTAGMILQNRLSAQFIRTENAFFTYYIPGASSQPPPTSSVGGLVIERGVADDAGNVTPTTGCIGTFVLPAEVRQWIVLNKNFLPEPPFTMEVRGFVTGISQAGDRFDSNEVKMFIQLTPDIVIIPDGEGGEEVVDPAAPDADVGGDGTGTEVPPVETPVDDGTDGQL